MFKVGETSVSIMGYHGDVFVVFERGDIRDIVIRFVKFGGKFIRCNDVKNYGAFGIPILGHGGDDPTYILHCGAADRCCSACATVVRTLGAECIGAAGTEDGGVDVFFCDESGLCKKPIMHINSHGMSMYIVNDDSVKTCLRYTDDIMDHTADYVYANATEAKVVL